MYGVNGDNKTIGFEWVLLKDEAAVEMYMTCISVSNVHVYGI